MIKVPRKPPKIVLDDKLAEEFRIARLYCDIPWQGDGAEQENPRQPESLQNEPRFARRECVEHDYHEGKKRRYRTFRKSA